ncbi:MAG: hypothetical protein JWN75_1110 [Candidatus Saccharibacteria bacterium]|nr:hypothetical protein [Candidatus Saccharibacteria bacterium]
MAFSLRNLVQGAENVVNGVTSVPRSLAARATRNTGALNQAVADQQKAFGPLPRYVNNIKEAVISPIPNLFRAAVNSPSEQAGSRYVNQAADSYGYTPEFRKQILNEHPVADKNLKDTGGYNIPNKGLFGRWNSLHFAENEKNPQARNKTITHEGLHSMYPKLSQNEKRDFLSRAQQTIGTTNKPRQFNNPVPREQMKVGVSYDVHKGQLYEPSQQTVSPIAKYLDERFNSGLYADYKGVESLNQIDQLPDGLNNEVHSYLINYYDQNKETVPQPLAEHYSRYLDPSRFTPTPRTPRRPASFRLQQATSLRPRQSNALQMLLKDKHGL